MNLAKPDISLPPIVFIHGMWSKPEVWDFYRPRFEAAGFVTHSPVLRYHDGPPGGPAFNGGVATEPPSGARPPAP